jgi:chemotaxis protein CheX
MILEKEIEFTQLLISSARENFETMIFMGLEEATEPGLSIQGSSLMGTITFRESLEGCFSITCSTDCARMIALNMLGMDPSEELSLEEISDAIGEVTNLIMGSIKKNLNDYVDNLEVSIPLVVSGHILNNNLGEGAQKVTVFVNIDEYLAELTMSYRNNVNG